MKSLIHAYFVAVLVLAAGCRAEKEGRAPEMKRATELTRTWEYLEARANKSPDLWSDAEGVLKKRVGDGLPASKREGLEQLYGLLTDPKGKASAADEALDVFVRLGATEVLREVLLNRRNDVIGWGLIIRATETLGNAKDGEAVPYLIYVLERNNYPQPGSEDATVHARMKRKLIEAIRATTGLDIEVSEIDENDPEQVRQVLSEAKAWAKRKGISLFKE